MLGSILRWIARLSKPVHPRVKLQSDPRYTNPQIVLLIQEIVSHAMLVTLLKILVVSYILLTLKFLPNTIMTLTLKICMHDTLKLL